VGVRYIWQGLVSAFHELVLDESLLLLHNAESLKCFSQDWPVLIEKIRKVFTPFGLYFLILFQTYAILFFYGAFGLLYWSRKLADCAVEATIIVTVSMRLDVLNLITWSDILCLVSRCSCPLAKHSSRFSTVSARLE